VEVLLIEGLRATPGEDAPPGLMRGLADAHTFSTVFSRHVGRPPGRYAREGSQHGRISP
jgi:hypothetical protein